MNATHPDGRGRVKLQTEVCLSGLPFGGAQCELFESASWTDVTATAGGVALTESIDITSLMGKVVIDFEPVSSGTTIPPRYYEDYFFLEWEDNGGDDQEIVDVVGNNVLVDSVPGNGGWIGKTSCVFGTTDTRCSVN